MKKQGKPKMSGRISCTPQTKDRLKDFARGLDLTYDDMLNFMYEEIADRALKPLFAGERLRDMAHRWKSSQKSQEEVSQNGNDN